MPASAVFLPGGLWRRGAGAGRHWAPAQGQQLYRVLMLEPRGPPAIHPASEDNLSPNYWDGFCWPQLVGTSGYMPAT